MRLFISVVAFGSYLLCAANTLYGVTWVESSEQFRQGTLQEVIITAEGDLQLAPQTFSPGAAGVFTSRILNTSEPKALRLVTWIENRSANSSLSVEVQAAPSAEELSTAAAPWVSVHNPQTEKLPIGRYFRYRVTFAPDGEDKTPSLKEILLSTETLQDKLAGQERPEIKDLTMSMMYQATGEKLYSFYRDLPYDASERGMYILRNAPGEKILPETYSYQPSERETFLPAKFGTWIVMRIHPLATFSNLSLKPAPVIMRAKDGREIEGPFDQHRAINFFDESFMAEYLAGIQAAVRYYKANNPFVVGYTIMPPEHFYDAQPWPQMTYLGGFGSYAKKNYFHFMEKIGVPVREWPTASNGDISLDAENYLWAYWRNWAAGEYIHRISRTIHQADPSAQIGAMTYVGDQWLRGLEPAFSEANPDLTYYYSSGLFPRIPGEDGLTGGTVLTYTKPQVLGGSRKLNLVEFDLSSPYVDMKRALAYARYSWAQNIVPAPIVLYGNYPQSTPPLNHLTKYTGMEGENGTPQLFRKLAEITKASKQDVQDMRATPQVAVVLPTFSLYSLLRKGEWKPHRYLQMQMNILKPLFEMGVSFDILTEGYMTKEVLDKYRLVIIQSPTAYPWMKDALENTKANVLALGWAATINTPGPKTLSLDIKPDEFSRHLTHAWPGRSGETSPALFTTDGRIIEEPTDFTFEAKDHTLLKGLSGKTYRYEGMGLAGRALPYLAKVSGDTLAKDSEGRAVFSEIRNNDRKIIRFGGQFWYRSADGKETSFFNDGDLWQFLSNVFDTCDVEYFPALGPLRVLRLSKALLIENTDSTPYLGPLPTPVNPPKPLPSKAHRIDVPAYGSTLLPDA